MHGRMLRFLGRCLMPLGGCIVFLVETIQREPFYETMRTYISGDLAGLDMATALAHKTLVASGFPIAEAHALLENGVASAIQLYGIALMIFGFLMYRVGLRH